MKDTLLMVGLAAAAYLVGRDLRRAGSGADPHLLPPSRRRLANRDHWFEDRYPDHPSQGWDAGRRPDKQHARRHYEAMANQVARGLPATELAWAPTAATPRSSRPPSLRPTARRGVTIGRPGHA